MGLFSKFRKEGVFLDLEKLKQEEYEQKYFDECKFIWKNYVPKNGQASVLQGELLREIEKLRCEAQDNGNINWDEDFFCFCDFIKKALCNQSIYSSGDKAKFELILSYIQDCGNYAMMWNNGNILDDELDIEKIAYTKDNLYDIIADAIGMLQARYHAPIPYEKNNDIKR